MAMTNLNALLGWAAFVLIALFMAGLFYVDVSARRLLTRIARKDASDTAFRSAAEAALGKGFRARLSWLKSEQPRLPGGASGSARMILRIYAFCWVTIVALFALWAVAMLMPKV